MKHWKWFSVGMRQCALNSNTKGPDTTTCFWFCLLLLLLLFLSILFSQSVNVGWYIKRLTSRGFWKKMFCLLYSVTKVTPCYHFEWVRNRRRWRKGVQDRFACLVCGVQITHKYSSEPIEIRSHVEALRPLLCHHHFLVVTNPGQLNNYLRFNLKKMTFVS